MGFRDRGVPYCRNKGKDKSMNNVTCKNFANRTETCHDVCKAYKAYESEQKAVSDARVKEKREAVHRNIKGRST